MDHSDLRGPHKQLTRKAEARQKEKAMSSDITFISDKRAKCDIHTIY
jgi:hypothetical protein